MSGVVFETQHVVQREFSRCVGIELTTSVLNLCLKAISGPLWAAFEMQVLQKMSCARVLSLLVP